VIGRSTPPAKSRPRSRSVAGFVLAVVAVLALAGCSASASANQAPVSTTSVAMPPSYRFDPVLIQVAAGATVRWHNGDNFTHSVKFDGDQGQGLVAKPGESVSRTFATAGTFAYVCAFHPQNMKGTVLVTG